MLPYFITLVIVMFILFFLHEKKTNKPNKFFYFISGAVLILFATIRSNNVGTDSNNYIGNFIRSSYSSQSVFNVKSSLEIGYLFLEKIALFFSKDYWSLFFVIASVSVLATYYIIYKLSMNIGLSVFIYISLATYLFFFNGARQAIAASIFAIALYYLIKKRMIRFFLFVIIASLFHKTALVMLPFYFILRFKFSYWNLILFSLGSFLALCYFTTIISLFDSSSVERYSVYKDRGATGGFILALFFVFVSFILIFLRKKILKNNLEEYDIYLHMCIFSSLIYLVVILTGSDVNFLRLSLYFSMGYILIWPIIFNDASILKIGFFRIIFVLVHLLFYFVYIFKMSNMNPYIFNEQLF